MSVVAFADQRTTDGRFAPGRSGNPAGRPKGARNRTTILAEAMLEEQGEALAHKLVERGLAGDGAALRFLVGRLLPTPTPSERAVELDLAPGAEEDLDEAFRVTLRAMADGEITPKEAATIGRFLATGAKLRLQRARLAALARRSAERARRAPARQAPVSDLYSARENADAPTPHPEVAPATARTEAARTGGAVTGAPVSDLYFSTKDTVVTSRLGTPRPRTGLKAPVSHLYSSTALTRFSAGRASASLR